MTRPVTVAAPPAHGSTPHRRSAPPPLPASRQARERRGRTAGVVGRLVVLAAVTLALAAVHLRHRPATFCLLRAVTGVPCPFCGGTTAAVDVGRGDLGAALRASPLALAVFAGWPLVGTLRPPRWWRRPLLRRVAIAVVLALAELWQLHRFGLLAA